MDIFRQVILNHIVFCVLTVELIFLVFCILLLYILLDCELFPLYVGKFLSISIPDCKVHKVNLLWIAT